MGMSASSETKAPQDQAPLPQVEFWEVDEKSAKFVRVYAELVSLEQHALRVRREGKIFVYESAYNLLDLLDEADPGDPRVLWVFAYTKDGGPAQLYQLPEDAIFTPEAATYRYRNISKQDRDRLVYEEGHNKDGAGDLARQQVVFQNALQDAVNYLRNLSHFAQSVPGSLLAPKQGPGTDTKVMRTKVERAGNVSPTTTGSGMKDNKRKKVELLSRQARKELKHNKGWLHE